MAKTQDRDANVGLPGSDSDNSSPAPKVEQSQGLVEAEDITRLSEAANLKDTAYAFSAKRKWWILTVVALCQTSMSK
jgi:hypothetical protein